MPLFSWFPRIIRPSATAPREGSPGIEGTVSAASERPRLAVLVDGDSLSEKFLDPMLRWVEEYGAARIKRIFRDWSTADLNRWRPTLLRHGIMPVHQYRLASRKNSTDIALVIDAMDLLHQRSVDGFCLVSSDSDFLRLVWRIREEGLLVLGAGSRLTLPELVGAFDRFLFFEDLQETSRPPGQAGASGAKRVERIWACLPRQPLIQAFEAIRALHGEEVPLAVFEEYLNDHFPELLLATNDNRRLGTLLQGSGLFELKTGRAPSGRGSMTRVRLIGGGATHSASGSAQPGPRSSGPNGQGVGEGEQVRYPDPT